MSTPLTIDEARKLSPEESCQCHYCTTGNYDENCVWNIETPCKVCGHELYRSECWNGCDDGYFDAYEDDPIYYQPGEMRRCDVCRGHGSLTFCPGCELKEKQAEEKPTERMKGV